jgi:protein SCO1/2
MKKFLLPLLLGVAAIAIVVALPFRAARPVPSPDCCAEIAPAAAAAPAAPLSARSLYQADLRWTDDRGQPFQLAALRGRPVVLAMFFTHCDNACPLLVAQLTGLREALPPAVRAAARFVLVSLDPARDTPEALQAYRARMRLEEGGWTLLRGGEDEVEELAMLLGVKYRADALTGFSHSNLVTVLAPGGEIIHQRMGLATALDETVRVISQAANTQPAP